MPRLRLISVEDEVPKNQGYRNYLVACVKRYMWQKRRNEKFQRVVKAVIL
jgi:hypothetical protein